jgi:DNA-binding NtrC family response regulator
MVFKEAPKMQTLTRIQVIPLEQIPLGNLSRDDAKNPPVVLVVDDERVIADTLSIILSRSGFVVQTAYDAASALELADLIPPQLLLSDVMMGPGMDGTQLAIEMIGAYPDCKVILFSGHAATADLLERTRELGHDFTLLTKPLHPADLLDHISDCFGAVTATAIANA